MKTGRGTGPSGDPRMRHIIVGTAGHIDHGKTALVYALTGTDTDRLPEEKERGITIDLGFAALDVQSPQGEKLHLSLIDVPGHHAFIRNMLAGAGGIDCVLLVIAADEGVKAQTEEHLAICSLLGIERGLVALTKIDAVDAERALTAKQEVEAFLQGSFLEGAPVLGVSALRGEGLIELKAAIAAMAAEAPERSSERVMRLPLDRSFSMRGFGTVVTGTLQAGVLRVGDSLEQHPGGRLLRVRGMQVHGRAQDAAQAPCRVALNLPGVEVAEIGRGDTLTVPGTASAARSIDVELSMLPGAPALKHGGRVRVHAFTAETLARVLLFDPQGERGIPARFARLRLADPLLVLPGDRIVLRQTSPAVTIGGATVLDTAAPAATRKAAALEWLKLFAAADEQQRLLMRVGRAGMKGIGIEMLQQETGLTTATLRMRMAALAEGGGVVEFREQQGYITAEALAAAVAMAEKEVARAGPLTRAALRSRIGLNAPVFELALDRLTAGSSYEVVGESVRRRGVGDAIPEHRRIQLQAIEEIYARAGLAAPLLSEVMRETRLATAEMRELITLLLRLKRLVRMGADDAFVHPGALQALYAELRKHRGESFDVGRFKQFTGLTRKHAIPLLEHLDSARVTRNNGGTRIVL